MRSNIMKLSHGEVGRDDRDEEDRDMAGVGGIRYQVLAVGLLTVLGMVACSQTPSETGDTTLTVASSITTSIPVGGSERVYLGIVRVPEAGIADPLGDLRRIQEAAPVPVPPVVSEVAKVACYDGLWRYVFEGLEPAWVWVIAGPDPDLVTEALDLVGAQNVNIIETVSLCDGHPTSVSTPTAQTSTTLTDTLAGSVLRGAGSSQLDQLGYQLGNALHGVDGRNVVGWGETSRGVQEASFIYDNQDGRSYEVWILFNPPDPRSLVFQFEAASLQLLRSEASDVGPITLYEAKPASSSVLAGQAMVLVCDDQIQLRTESYLSPQDARDELLAITALLDCAAAFD